MNPFSVLMLEMGLSSESQGSGNQYGWLYLVLSLQAANFAANPTALTYSTNPAREVLHRLSGYPGHAYQQIAKMLSGYVDKYEARQ